LVSEPEFVVEIVAVPPAEAVKVNVTDGVPVERVTVVGEKLPLNVDAGVITVELAVPPDGVSVTVKLDEGEPTVPLDGPARL
jgi:YbbR domain-containing protein